jgi:hypothetical protein
VLYDAKDTEEYTLHIINLAQPVIGSIQCDHFIYLLFYLLLLTYYCFIICTCDASSIAFSPLIAFLCNQKIVGDMV